MGKPLTLELELVPRVGWQEEFEALHVDNWLVQKMHRPKRIREHIRYARQYVPEIQSAAPGLVIDIGPGCGELLELCRIWGHNILGIDALDGAGGMGDGYLAWSKLIVERQQVPVLYCSFRSWIQQRIQIPEFETSVLINSRGSIEQCFHEFLVGTPVGSHDTAAGMTWDSEQRAVQIRDEFVLMFTVFQKILRKDGFILIHANGTGSVKSDQFYDATIRSAAESCGLELVRHEGLRLHKWLKK